MVKDVFQICVSARNPIGRVAEAWNNFNFQMNLTMVAKHESKGITDNGFRYPLPYSFNGLQVDSVLDTKTDLDCIFFDMIMSVRYGNSETKTKVHVKNTDVERLYKNFDIGEGMLDLLEEERNTHCSLIA